MTLHDASRLFRYWAATPPLRDLVAGFMGVKSPSQRGPVSEAIPELPEFED